MATVEFDVRKRGSVFGRFGSAVSNGRALRFRVSLSFAMVGLLLLGFAASQGAGGLEVSAPEGPSLEVCPFEFDARPAPARVVLQVIELQFHKWEEHDLSQDAFCIVMLEPDRRVLELDEAWALLEASMSWVEQEPDPAWAVVIDAAEIEDIPPAVAPYLDPALLREEPGVTPSPEPDLPAPPAFPRRPDSETGAQVRPFDSGSVTPDVIIGTDDRTRVTNTTVFPWWVIGYQSQQFSDGSARRCTAFVVAPHTILTNGHCTYNASRGGYATSISFAPGQQQSVAGGTVTRPFGLHSSVQWQTNSGYIANPISDVDYAASHYNQSFANAGITTYMPLLFNYEPTVINTAGYPGTVQTWNNNQAMWYSGGDVVGVLERTLRYLADTSGGQSGSPVWRYNSATNTRQVVAVHAFGSSAYNGGPRLVTQNQAVIEQWMTWEPTGSPGNDDFADAYPISGSSGSTSGTNVGATKEPGEPNHAGNAGGASVWWTWTAPASGEATIDTFGSTFDTLLAVYTGTSFQGIAANDDAGGTLQSSVIFPATAGTLYRIAVDGYGAATGPIQLTWALDDAPPPPGDAGLRPVASDCGGTGVGDECSVWIDLVDNEAELGGFEFQISTPAFTPVSAQTVGIAVGCLASVGPTGLVGVICAQPFSGSGEVARIDLTRAQGGDSVFVTSDVLLIAPGGNATPGWGDELPVPEIVCDIAHYADHPLGDFNADGVVSTPDALLILRTAVGALPPPASGTYASYHGDLNSDGAITTADALLALQKAVDPTRPARLAVAPRTLTLAQGQSACVLIGNAGSLALPSMTTNAPAGLAVNDITHAGAIGRVQQVTRTGASVGTITFNAGGAGSLTVTVEP
jgi:V8-like Glu-specific endopeptidase